MFIAEPPGGGNRSVQSRRGPAGADPVFSKMAREHAFQVRRMERWVAVAVESAGDVDTALPEEGKREGLNWLARLFRSYRQPTFRPKYAAASCEERSLPDLAARSSGN